LASYKSYRKSLEHIAAVERADESAERARQLADGGIPPDGALNLLRTDPQTQGPKLFRKHCAACHDYVDERGNGIHVLRPLEYPVDEKGHVLADKPFVANGAPNLYGFATRSWIAGLLDPGRIGRVKHGKETWEVTDAPYFGNTEHGARGGGMVEFVRDNLSALKPADKTVLENVVAALSAEAGLKSQRSADQQAEKNGVLAAGRKAIAGTSWNEASACVDCHKFHDKGELGDAPELTGYGSRQWLLDFVGNPAHKRFYGKKNDRMPAFAADAARPRNNLLTPREMELIVDWLRGQW
jgi:ubiquinol-cytochrome c reductase cytochrome b subunit